jgi:predicted lipid-binding transport protein (Tim44 family)
MKLGAVHTRHCAPVLPDTLRRMNRRLGGAAVLCAVLLAGCSSEREQPRTLPPVSAAPSPSASEAAPVPSAAQAETPEGASAFARFFYAEVQRAFAAKDPEIVRRLSAPGCKACDRFITSLTNLRDEGGRVTDVLYDIKAAEAPATDGQTARVTVIYDSPAIQGFDAQGNVVREEPAVTGFEEQLDLVRGAGGWLVQEVTAP